MDDIIVWVLFIGGAQLLSWYFDKKKKKAQKAKSPQTAQKQAQSPREVNVPTSEIPDLLKEIREVYQKSQNPTTEGIPEMGNSQEFEGPDEELVVDENIPSRWRETPEVIRKEREFKSSSKFSSDIPEVVEVNNDFHDYATFEKNIAPVALPEPKISTRQTFTRKNLELGIIYGAILGPCKAKEKGVRR